MGDGKLTAWVRGLSRADAVLILLTCFVTSVPPAVNLLRYGPARRLFSFAAADTFYYLTVARNVARTGKVSFDGEHLTNGFHPLWQAVTACAALVVRWTGAGDIWLLAAAIGLGFVLTTLATLLLGLALRRQDTGLTPAFALLPVGGATLVVVPFMRHFYDTTGRPSTTLWGAVNGMETALVLAAYAACALAYVRIPRTPRGGLVLGTCLGALVLSRLDHGVFSAAMAASLLALGGRKERTFALVAIGTFATIVGAYLGLNKLWFGLALPVSGTLKSTFPHSQRNGRALVLGIFFYPRSLVATYGHRALLLAVPAVVAGATLFFSLVKFAWRAVLRAPSRSEEALRIEALLLSTAIGVLGLFAYDYLYVPARNQGHWYFPVSHLFVSLVLIEGVRAVLDRISACRRESVRTAIGGAIAVVSVVGYQRELAQGNVDNAIARFFFDEAPKIRAFYEARDRHPPRLFEFDDGIITFSTGFPAMSGMGLAIDREAIPAAATLGSGQLDRNTLFELGLARGYDRFATLVYGHGPVTHASTTRQIRVAYGGFLGAQAWHCNMDVEYLSESGAFAIIHTVCPKGIRPIGVRGAVAPAH
jgi:hypothetical protein